MGKMKDKIIEMLEKEEMEQEITISGAYLIPNNDLEHQQTLRDIEFLKEAQKRIESVFGTWHSTGREARRNLEELIRRLEHDLNKQKNTK